MATQAPIQSVVAPGIPVNSDQLSSNNSLAGPGGAPAQNVTTGTQLAFRGQMAIGAESEATSERMQYLSPACARLPVALAVTVPVRGFRVRNLLAMTPGEVIQTQWGYGEDLPLSSGDVQLAWSEFEVIDTRLAVRVTRLA